MSFFVITIDKNFGHYLCFFASFGKTQKKYNRDSTEEVMMIPIVENNNSNNMIRPPTIGISEYFVFIYRCFWDGRGSISLHVYDTSWSFVYIYVIQIS